NGLTSGWRHSKSERARDGVLEFSKGLPRAHQRIEPASCAGLIDQASVHQVERLQLGCELRPDRTELASRSRSSETAVESCARASQPGRFERPLPVACAVCRPRTVANCDRAPVFARIPIQELYWTKPGGSLGRTAVQHKKRTPPMTPLNYLLLSACALLLLSAPVHADNGDDQGPGPAGQADQLPALSAEQERAVGIVIGTAPRQGLLSVSMPTARCSTRRSWWRMPAGWNP